jgi:hypothetical protein
MVFDLKTIITLVVFVFGAGGGWYTLKSAVDDVKLSIAELKDKQDAMDEKLDAAVHSDGIQDNEMKNMRENCEENRNLIRSHTERSHP